MVSKTATVKGAGINRIRLEFKCLTDLPLHSSYLHCTVLIESDWNLNVLISLRLHDPEGVYRINRIRLEFKVRVSEQSRQQKHHAVLIESDWNLNESFPDHPSLVVRIVSINRIRLEFKGRKL